MSDWTESQYEHAALAARFGILIAENFDPAEIEELDWVAGLMENDRLPMEGDEW